MGSSTSATRAELDGDIAALLASGPAATDGGTLDLADVRRRVEDGARLMRRGPEIETVLDLAVSGVPVRRYAARSAWGHVLYVHGGGWVSGGLEYSDEFCRLIADRTGAVVTSVDYRLAPEHPFPAGLDDVSAVLRHLLDGTREPLTVAGDSAGANLAAAAVRRIEAAASKLSGLVLIYPVLDYAAHVGEPLRTGRDAVLTPNMMRWFWDLYMPDRDQRQAVEASPGTSVDERAFPPTLLATAGWDLLRDEGQALAARLKAVGTPVELREHSTLPHGFMRFTAQSRRAAAATDELATAVHRSTGHDVDGQSAAYEGI